MKHAVLLLALLVACRPQGQDHDHPHEGDHDHPHPHASQAEPERPDVAHTIWTEKTELFAEHPALVQGQDSRFAVHLTRLSDFRALEAGRVQVTVQVGRQTFSGQVEKPRAPGIFGVTVRPGAVGPCQLWVDVQGPELQDRIPVQSCEVFANVAAAQKKLGGEDEAPAGQITFLKEQQWQIPFATEVAAERTLQPTLEVWGQIDALPGRRVQILAPAPGWLTWPLEPPQPGTKVARDQVLAIVPPRLVATADRATLQGEVDTAKAEVDLAQSQAARARRLLAEGAVPARQVDEAQARLRTARARLTAAQARWRQFAAGTTGDVASNGVQVRAPLEGTVLQLLASAGAPVEAGTPLLEVADLRQLLVLAQVFPADLQRLPPAPHGWALPAEATGTAQALDLGPARSVSAEVDAQNRTITVRFALDDPTGRWRLGQALRVRLALGAPRQGLAVPEEALVDDAGQPVVFVQTEGEAFERRAVGLGIRDRGWVEVTSGLKAGDRLVTTGAYAVRLAAASGTVPAHGHTH